METSTKVKIIVFIILFLIQFKWEPLGNMWTVVDAILKFVESLFK